MTKNKDLKRLVRRRMKKTGESYTAARQQLTGSQKQRAKKDFARLAGMSDPAVKDKTANTWAQWVKILDDAGAVAMSHRDIARWLRQEHDVGAWWAQSVTVGYERIRGLRDTGQQRGGLYDANKSKTIGVPLAQLYKAVRHSRSRAHWLPELELTISTATVDKSIRATLSDGTALIFYFEAKGANKARVSLQHRKLPTKKALQESKDAWTVRFGRLAEYLRQ